MEGQAGRILQSARSLSSSQLWSVQGDYFRRSGVQAWASGDVPHTLTSGPLVARAYVEVVEGFAADCAAGRLGAVDPTEPLYVVELGAGTGRLGFHFLETLDPVALQPFRVVYVLTDMAESNLEFWRSHPRLAEPFAQGRLDLARFDATSDAELHLERAGVTLGRRDLANPLVVVANYLFDVLPQDLFALRGSELHEELVALVAEEPDLDPAAPDFLRRVWLATSHVAAGRDHYGEPDLDALLAEIAHDRAEGGPARFLYPAPALRCLRHLTQLSGSRTLVLVGERPGALPEHPAGATAGPETGPGPEPPAEAFRPAALLGLSVHGGSFSLPVDLEILARYAEDRGGSLLLPSALPAGLLVSAILLGAPDGAPMTRHRFRLAVDDGGPEDLFLAMRPALGDVLEQLPLAVVLALLRVGGYDPYLFRTLHPVLVRRLPEAEPAGVEEAVRAFDEVWEHYYPIDDETDVAFGIAALLAPAGRYAEALRYLELSRETHGSRPLVSFNTALCHVYLGDLDAARAEVAEALRLEPGMEQALRLEAELERTGA